MGSMNVIEHHTEQANKRLVGRSIKSVRYLSPEEAQAHGWRASSLVLTLDDGTVLYPSSDDEGNNAGSLFGITPKGHNLTFPRVSTARF